MSVASAVGYLPRSENGAFVLTVLCVLGIEVCIVFGVLQMSRAVYIWIDYGEDHP